jgi:hypothetical protein
VFIAIKAVGHTRGWFAVKDALERCHLLQQVGGEARLIDIFTFPHDAYNVDYALGEVLRASRQRRAAQIGTKLSSSIITAEEAVTELNALGRDSTISIRSPEAILALPRDANASMLRDRLLAKGQSLVIAGVGGVGKTRLLLQLLVALILGRLWCGIETLTRGLTCLLLQTENGNALCNATLRR